MGKHDGRQRYSGGLGCLPIIVGSAFISFTLFWLAVSQGWIDV